VVEAARLHRARERRARGLTLLEGPNLIEAAIGSGATIEHTFVATEDPDPTRWPSPLPVEEAVLRKLAGTETPRGPVAVIGIPPPAPLPGDRHIMVLWGLSDPGNVGTIIRSAAAFGFAVAVGPDTADPWAPKTLRAGAGGHFHTTISSIDVLDYLPGRIAATVVAGGVDPRNLEDGPWSVVIGSEAHGLGPDLVARADASITIPMPGGTESLNAATAAGIVAYALTASSGAEHLAN
jgi:TrmH family RNA methyltransferase